MDRVEQFSSGLGTVVGPVNESGLKPLGHAVLVRPYEPERANGLIEIPNVVRERTQMVEQRAVVVEVGPECWQDERAPRASPGDRVLVTKYAGYLAEGTADGRLYRLVNDRDIFAGIVEEAKNG